MKTSYKQIRIYRAFINWLNAHFPVMLAKLRFRKMFGRTLDLKNPKDINEKILWLSLYSDISEWTRLADKYAVREYVKGAGLGRYLVPLYGKWDKAEDIDWESLPDSFVMKTNNGSGTVLIVNNKNSLEKEQTTKLLDNWLKTDIAASTTEFQYADIKPCIIAEELLDFTKDANKSSSAIDYKIWCFNGEPHYIWACKNRVVGQHTEVALFDLEWNYLPEKSIFNEHYREQEKLVTKPKNLDEMIKVAKTLSKPFPVVRVDLYNINGRIYFGEMTFTSLGGTMDFYTPECLLEMGSMIDISGVKKVRHIHSL